jgi:hypothetical protein
MNAYVSVGKMQKQLVFQLKMLDQCVLITLTAVLKLLVSLHEARFIITYFPSGCPMGSDEVSSA